MRTINANIVTKGERVLLDLDKSYGDFGKKVETPSCFYNYAADREAQFFGFIDLPTSDFINSLGWED